MLTKATAAYPYLRPDLVIEKQQDGHVTRYLIIDPISNRYWQCGAPQYALLALLTGELTPDEVVQRYTAQTHIRLRLEQLESVLEKLQALGFLAEGHGETSLQPASPNQARRWVTPGDLIFSRYTSKRWRIFPAQKLLFLQERHTRWLFEPGALVLYAALAAITAWILVYEGGWSQGIVPLLGGLYVRFSPATWGQLLIALFITALIHECAHALALRHFGRQPGFFGVGVSLFAGVFCYVEIGEIWRLSKRGHKVAVGLAGPLGSLVTGAVGALAWWLLPRDQAASSWLAMLMALGVFTALYNLLPFWRTDGYFALADWMRVPHLERKAQAELIHLLRGLFHRQQRTERKSPLHQRLVLAGYGVLAMLAALWLFVVVVSLLWNIIVTVALHLL